MDEKETPAFVVQVTEFVDDRGRRVRQHDVVAGEVPPEHICYVGDGAIEMRTQAGVMRGQFPVPLPNAMTIVEAFEQLDSALQAAGEEAKREAMENQRKILPAGALPPGTLPPDLRSLVEGG